jgi:hypothetical protein
MIRAELTDGSFIRVAPRGLDLLLRNGRVKRFLRSSGWAVVGIDQIRASARSQVYSGPERRSAA